MTAEGWLEADRDGHRPACGCSTRSRERDHARRFSFWYPCTAGEEAPIYVHAKLMIVDDEVLRVGSANLNNRSMGLDSECDVFIDCARPAQPRLQPGDPAPAPFAARRALRARPGRKSAALIEQHGSMAAMIEALPAERPGPAPAWSCGN